MAGEKNPNEHQGNDTFILLAYLLRDISFVFFFELDQLCIFLFLSETEKKIISYGYSDLQV